MQGRSHSRAIFTGLLVVVLIACILWLIASSETFADCIGRGATDPSSLRLPVSILKFVDGVNLHGSCALHAANEYQGAITSAAAIVMALFTAMLWTAMSSVLKVAEAHNVEMARATKATEDAAAAARNSVELSRHSFVAQNTAYVMPLMFRSERVVDTTTGRIAEWRFVPQWRNTGNTPATHVQHMTNAKLFPIDGMPPDFDFPDNQRMGPNQSLGKSIGPGSTMPGPHCSIDTATFRGIRNRYRFFIWCWIEYRDVFPGTPIRRTEWCSELVLFGDPTDPRLSDETLFRLDVVDRFNGADDDCYRRPGERARLVAVPDLAPPAEGGTPAQSTPPQQPTPPQSSQHSFTMSYPGWPDAPAGGGT